MSMQDCLIKVSQAAKIAKVTPQCVRSWLKSGKIKYYELPTGSPKKTRITRIRLSSFLAFLGANGIEPEPPERFVQRQRHRRRR
jgi:phage antirepressor YoqD-like protein